MRAENESRLLFWVVVLFWFAQYIYMPFFTPHLATIGIAASLTGVIAGSYGFTQLVARIPLSIADSLRANHRPFMLGGLVFAGLASALPLFFSSGWVFLACRIVSGIASSTWVSYVAFVLEGDASTAAQRMAKIVSANNLGILSAQVLGTALFSHTGILPLFAISAVTAAIGFILLAMGPVGRPQPHAAAPQPFTLHDFGEVLRDGHLWLCSALMAVSQFVLYASTMSFSGVFAQALGAGGLALGLISILFLISGMAAAAVYGRAQSHKINQRGILAASFAVSAAACMLTGFCTAPWQVVLLQLFSGGARNLQYVILMASASRSLSSRQKSMSMGIFQSIYSIGMTAGPLAAGFLFEHTSYATGFLLLGLGGVAGAVWAALCFKNQPPAAP